MSELKEFDLLNEQNLLTKAGMKIFAEKFKANITEGKENPLQAYIKLDALEKTVKEAKQLIYSEAISESDNYNGIERNVLGVGFNQTTRKPTRNYSAHVEWVELTNKIKTDTENLKKLEKIILMQCENGSPILVESTGEVLSSEDFPIEKPGYTSLALKYPKGGV